MKYVIIAIMALLLVGSVFGAMKPAQIVNPNEIPAEPMIEVVEEPTTISKSSKEYCNFDIEKPYCLIGVWKKNKEIIVNDEVYKIDYNYRKNKNLFSINNNNYNLERHGGFYIGDFDIEGRNFELWRTHYRLRVVEV